MPPPAAHGLAPTNKAAPPLGLSLRSNGKAAKALTEIGSPAIDWVALAQVLVGCSARREHAWLLLA